MIPVGSLRHIKVYGAGAGGMPGGQAWDLAAFTALVLVHPELELVDPELLPVHPELVPVHAELVPRSHL
jgi:hypothetical protein